MDGSQTRVTDTVDTLVYDGKTLRGSIAENASGAARFIAQVSLYSNTLGITIAQNTYATDSGSEISALRELLDRVELCGWLVQADGSLPLVKTDRLTEQESGDHLAQEHQITLVTDRAVLTEGSDQLSMEPGVGIREGLVWRENPKLSWLPAHPIT